MEVRKGKHTQPLFHLFQVSKIFLAGIAIISCILTINRINLSTYFPIKTVRVYGINRVSQDEVRQLILPLVDHGFFGINVEFIRERLLQIPWVGDIFVRRNWPDLLEITLIEKNPIARWNDESLLSDSGSLFAPAENNYPKDLPRLIGPSGKHIIMLQYFNEMNRLFTPIRAKISYLELTPYFTWKLKLDNGISLQIGHKGILTRLSHFVKVYPKIVGDRAAYVDSMDLRYPYGIAVRWKETAKA